MYQHVFSPVTGTDRADFSSRQHMFRIPPTHQTNLSQLPQELPVADNDDTQRHNKTGDEESDDEGVIMRVPRVPVEGRNQSL